ncbi:MAG: NAD(+)/NADH kinase [Deltaproteobacteria bacterium]|nr:NAD(+)/NADH kinase [Deltaproteobacteria bacterium]
MALDEKKVGIAGKPTNPQACHLALELIAWLNEKQIAFRVDEQLAQCVENKKCLLSRIGLLKECDPVVVFGGDGTLISVSRNIGEQSPLIIGVNVGTLGYLTECSVDDYLTVLELALRGEVGVIKKQLLEGKIIRDGQSVMSFRGINDVVIGKGALGRIYGINLFINSDENAAYFRGDGIIIATPAGSTAYSLAAGGAIVHPRISALLVTPICSHVLTSRPLVLPGDVKLRMTIADEQYASVENTKKMYLTIDGQVGQEIALGDEIHVSLSAHFVRYAKSQSRNYFDVLSHKLKWGAV